MEEHQFVDEMLADPTDDLAKLVYADWLDDHGDERGEYIRLAMRIRGGEKLNRRERRRARKLVERLDGIWMTTVTSPKVENCNAAKTPDLFSYECPLEWQQLERIGRKRAVRFCDQCQLRVYFCQSMEAANERAVQGNCVAIALGNPRRSHDLGQRAHRQYIMGRM